MKNYEDIIEELKTKNEKQEKTIESLMTVNRMQYKEIKQLNKILSRQIKKNDIEPLIIKAAHISNAMNIERTIQQAEKYANKGEL